MAILVRCRSCGFVIEEGRLGEVCPACGVPRKVFEPFADTVSRKRRMLLSFDLHPIIVHFPVSFGVSAFAVAVFVLAFPELFTDIATIVLAALTGVLPAVAALAIASGIFDGKIRFRRVTTPLLKRKIALGSLFFICSLAAAVLAFAVGPSAQWVRIVDAILLANCVAAAVGLGKIGTRLATAMFPG